MAQYVERSSITDALLNNTSLEGYDLEEAVNAICAIPAADVRPVVRAKWSCKRTKEHDGDWYCTACNKELTIYMGNREDRYAFCPYCGALMEEI